VLALVDPRLGFHTCEVGMSASSWTRFVRGLALRGVAVTVGLLALVLIAELGLRLLPVTEPKCLTEVNEASPVLRYEPDRTFTLSAGWRFHRIHEVHSNNYGFISPVDYTKDDDSPLLAVVGDSFVEAFAVPMTRTFARRLANELPGHRIYTFGVSGAALSQYLVYASFVRDEFAPDALIITVVGNDFDESLRKYGDHRGFHQFVEDADGRLVLRRADLENSPGKLIARNSRLLTYAFFNLELPNRLKSVFRGGDDEARWVGNTDARADPERIADSKRVVEAFLQRLPRSAGLEPERILFLVDGMRPQLYEPGALDRVRDSYFGRMRRFFIDRAVEAGFEVVDLQPVFAEQARRDGRHFEFPDDAHWNEHAHEVIAGVVRDTRTFRAFRSIAPVDRSNLLRTSR